MKNLFLLLLLLQLNLGFGQIQFELVGNGSDIGLTTAVEIDDGYLFSAYVRGEQMLIKVGESGAIIDSVRLAISAPDTVRFKALDLHTHPDGYVAIGRLGIGADTSLYFFKAEYSEDLELVSETHFPIPFTKKSTKIEFTWDGVSDTILYTFYQGDAHVGWLNSETGEFFDKNFHPQHPYIYKIIRRPNQPGYLGAGMSMYLLDEGFNIVAHNYVSYTTKNPVTGLDVEYFNDSTFMFSSIVFDADSSLYFDEGTSGIFVGIASDSLEILKWDTISISTENSNWISAVDQKYLARSSDTTFIVAGETEPYADNYNRLFCAKYNTNAERIFSYVYYLNEYRHYEVNVLATSDGGCLIYGHMWDPATYPNSNLYALKIGPDGLVTGESSIPMGIAPIQVYPNPTSDVIRFDLKDVDSTLDFELVDMSGRIVLRQKVSGPTEISTSHLPKGVYGYRLLKHGKPIYTGKMVKE